MGLHISAFFPLCLGVAATTIWHKVLEENGVNAIDDDGSNDTTHKNFMTCVKFFVKSSPMSPTWATLSSGSFDTRTNQR
eukprot:scaffold143690_cov76-Cyclotella_meneghiniana.AAC.2